MGTRIELQNPDGTVVRPVIVGPESAQPLANAVPAESWYFADDTGTLSFSDGTSWHPALDTRPVSDGTTTTIGVVELRTDPASGTAVAYTEDDIGAADGVVGLDSGGLVPRASLPIAGRLVRGAFQGGGSGISIDVDGNITATSAGSGSLAVYHNGMLVSLESILAFLDSASVTFTVTDDSGNTRVEVQAATDPTAVVVTAALSSGSHTYLTGARRTIMSLSLTEGTWLMFGTAAIGNAGVGAGHYDAEFVFTDGTNDYGPLQVTCGDSANDISFSMMSDPIEVGPGGLTVSWAINTDGGTWLLYGTVTNESTAVATTVYAARLQH